MSQCDKSSISKSVARSTDDSTFGYQQYITHLMHFCARLGDLPIPQSAQPVKMHSGPS